MATSASAHFADDEAEGLDLPPLDRPSSDDRSAPAPDDDEPLVSDEAPMVDVAEVLSPHAELDEAELAGMLHLLPDEPSALGDDESGLRDGEDEEGASASEQEISFLGAEELPTDEDATLVDDGIELGEDDGGAEGLDLPSEEALDELPPLDGYGHEDAEGELIDDALERELGLVP